jgi:hypothetical protein
MRKLADKAYFKSQCETAFEKMLNLVPGDVTLTEPLEPADIRPYISSYQLKNGSVEFSGRIRVRVTPVTGRDQDSLTASIIPASRGNTTVAEIAARRATFRGGTSFGYLDENFLWFEFDQTLSAAEAFDSFTIRINDETYDNGGTGGYPVNPDVLYQQEQSCVLWDAAKSEGTLKITAAVSKSLLQGGATPQVNVAKKMKQQNNFIPRLQPEIIPMTRSSKETAEYVYYTVSTMLPGTRLDPTFDIMVGDSTVEYISAGGLTSQECASL